MQGFWRDSSKLFTHSLDEMSIAITHTFNAPLQENNNTMLKRVNMHQKWNKGASKRINSNNKDEEKDLREETSNVDEKE